MGKYIVNIKFDVFVEHEIKADSLEHAIKKAREVSPDSVLRLKTPSKTGVHDW